VFLAVGTSGVVQPAASLPLEASSNGATLLEINPQQTSLTARADFVIPEAAGVALPGLLRRIKE
jgi:NAD-dependent deacetylase